MHKATIQLKAMQLIRLGLPSLFGTTLFTEIDKTWPVPILVAIHFTVEIGCLFPCFKTHTLNCFSSCHGNLCVKLQDLHALATTATSQGAILEHANECPNFNSAVHSCF